MCTSLYFVFEFFLHRKCIQGLLSDRMVFLTTHSTKYYSTADRIIQLEAGSILAQGNLETLKNTLAFEEFVHEEPGKQDMKIVDDGEVWGCSGKFVECANLEKEEEDQKRGSVSLKVYLKYLLYGASPCILFAVPILYFSGAG